MKKLHEKLDDLYEWLDRHWLALPLKKQRMFLLLFFAGYVLLTAGVMVSIWYETGKTNLHIEQIEIPVRPQDEAILDTLIFKQE